MTDIESGTKTSSGRRTERIGLLIACIVLALRAGPHLAKNALWLDEAYSRAAIDHLGVSLSSTYGTMGIYYALLAGWGQLSVAPWWLRSLSLLFALGTLVLVQPIARRVGGTRVATVTPVLLTVSPTFVWAATEARAYAMEMLVVTACWYALIRAIEPAGKEARSQRRRWWVTFTVLAVCAPLIHGLFIAMLAGMAALCLLSPRPLRALRPFAPAIIGSTAVLLAMLFWAGNDIAGAAQANSTWNAFGALSTTYLSSWWWIAVAIGIPLIAGVFVATKSTRASTHVKSRMIQAVPLAWVFVPLVILMVLRTIGQSYLPRYLTPVVPAIAMLIGIGAFALDDGLRKRQVRRPAPRTLTWTGPVVAILAILVVVSIPAPSLQANEAWDDAAKYVATLARPGDGLVFATVPTTIVILPRVPFEAAWSRTEHGAWPKAVSPPRPLGSVRRVDTPLTQAELFKSLRTYDRVWVVDYYGSDSKIGLTEHPPFTTDLRLASTRDFGNGIIVSRFDRIAPPQPN